MPNVYLSIGTNIGDRLKNLQTAVDKLAKDYLITGISQVYETEPVGEVIQDDFYNIVVAMTVSQAVSPKVLLAKTQQIEKDLKRVKTIHWGPRTIDLDILLFDDLEFRTKDLTIPHREMANRLFVLQPLQEVSESVGDKVVSTLADKLLSETTDKNWVRPVDVVLDY